MPAPSPAPEATVTSGEPALSHEAGARPRQESKGNHISGNDTNSGGGAKLPPKRIIRFATALNVLGYRLSGGRLMSRLEGAPICLVTMTGRKSGKRKTLALMHTPNGNDVLLVASLGGAPTHPVWYYNLKAHPEIEIQVGSVRRRMLAREASVDEKRALWPVVVANYRSFEDYQKRTTREIPLFVCSPAPA